MVGMAHKSREKANAYKRAHAQLPEQRARIRKFRMEHPERNRGDYPPKRKSHLKTRYGITDADYYEILKRQNNCCAICKATTPNNGFGNRFFDVDHCHITGKVRGVLCRDCNVTIGVVEKKKEKLILIEKYLLEHTEHDPHT